MPAQNARPSPAMTIALVRDRFEGRAMARVMSLVMAVFILVPLSFQGALGLTGMLAPDIYSGMGVGKAMAGMLGGGPFLETLVAILLVFALLLTIMTAMAGSSRTLYQSSIDGWLPRYLSHVNEHGAPTRAMWTDLTFNLILLLMSDYLFVLAVSNVCYIVFNFLNLNAGWIHRIDNAHVRRPWKAPDWLLATGVVLAFVNAFARGTGQGSTEQQQDRLKRLLKAVGRCRLPHREGRNAPRELIPRRRGYPERQRPEAVDKKS